MLPKNIYLIKMIMTFGDRLESKGDLLTVPLAIETQIPGHYFRDKHKNEQKNNQTNVLTNQRINERMNEREANLTNSNFTLTGVKSLLINNNFTLTNGKNLP